MSDRNYEALHELAAGYVDDELTPQEREEFEKAMKENPDLQDDVAAFRRINDLTGQVRFEELPDPVWEAFSASLYRRAESAVGWILLSLGAIIMLSLVGWGALNGFFADPDAPLISKVGVGAVSLGGIVLLVSKLRETLFARKRDRYGKVQK